MLIDGVLSGISGDDCGVDVVATLAAVEVRELGETPGIDSVEVGVEVGMTADVEIVGVVELDTLVDVSSGVEEESEDDEDDVEVVEIARNSAR